MNVSNTKIIKVNGTNVQLVFAPKGNEQIPQKVWELLKTVYAKQMQEKTV